jgi:serine/threonine protein kinase
MNELDAERVFARVARSMLGEDVEAPRIGRYALRDKLGSGAMGEVYGAWDPQHQREVAIKVVRTDREGDDSVTHRLEREARALERIDHPNVVRVHEVGRDAGRLFIVMERLLGETLQTRLEREGRLAPTIVHEIVAGTCAGIGHAHALAIVHRDLKPANVFLTESGVKVLDFGIAKGLAGGTLGASTMSGAVLGTPHYMSPEQATDSKRIDHRTDLWSVGVIAYECLVGARPFEGANVAELAVAIVSGDPPPPSRRIAEISTDVDAWFARALARDPAARFQSAEEMPAVFADAIASPRRASMRVVHAVAVAAIAASLIATIWFTRSASKETPAPAPAVGAPEPAQPRVEPPPADAAPRASAIPEKPRPKRRTTKPRADVDDLEF